MEIPSITISDLEFPDGPLLSANNQPSSFLVQQKWYTMNQQFPGIYPVFDIGQALGKCVVFSGLYLLDILITYMDSEI